MTIDDTNGHLRGWSDEIGDRCGPVTPAEAFEILARFCHSHFDGRKGDVGREKARISIPADPRRDDDLRMHAFIAQSAELRAEVERLTRERDEAEANVRAWADERAAMRHERDHCRAEIEAMQPRLQAAIDERNEAQRREDERTSQKRAAYAEADRLTAEMRGVAAERDRLLAALAEVREAGRVIVDMSVTPYSDRGNAATRRWEAVLRALPTDLAATRDARVRAEALREAAGLADAQFRGVAEADRAQTWASCARMLRSEADRIERGGR